MSGARRSLIVMLPGALVDALDERAAQSTAQGQPRGRDELIADAVERWLAAPPEAERGPGGATLVADPASVDHVARRVMEDLGQQQAGVRETTGRRARAVDDQLFRLEAAATAHDRAAFSSLAVELLPAHARIVEAVTEALGELEALATSAGHHLLGVLPALGDDARSRWMSAQAGRGLAPDRIVRAAAAIDRAKDTRERLTAAVVSGGESIARARAQMAHVLATREVTAGDLQPDEDLDDQTWGFTATQMAAQAGAMLRASRSVLEVGYDNAHALARASLELVVLLSRDLAEELQGIPDLASACA